MAKISIICAGSTPAKIGARLFSAEKDINLLAIDTAPIEGLPAENTIELAMNVRNKGEEIASLSSINVQEHEKYAERIDLDPEAIAKLPPETTSGSGQNKVASLLAFMAANPRFKEKWTHFKRKALLQSKGRVYLLIGISGSAGAGMYAEIIAYLVSEGLQVILLSVSPEFVSKDISLDTATRDKIMGNAFATMLQTQYMLESPKIDFADPATSLGYPPVHIMISAEYQRHFGWHVNRKFKIDEAAYLDGMAQTVRAIVDESSAAAQAWIQSYTNKKHNADAQKQFHAVAVLRPVVAGKLQRLGQLQQDLEGGRQQDPRAILAPIMNTEVSNVDHLLGYFARIAGGSEQLTHFISEVERLYPNRTGRAVMTHILNSINV